MVPSIDNSISGHDDNLNDKQNSLNFLLNSPNPFKRTLPVHNVSNINDNSLIHDSNQGDDSIKVKTDDRSNHDNNRNNHVNNNGSNVKTNYVDNNVDIEKFKLLENVCEAIKVELDLERKNSKNEINRLNDIINSTNISDTIKDLQKSHKDLSNKITKRIEDHNHQVKSLKDKLTEYENLIDAQSNQVSNSSTQNSEENKKLHNIVNEKEEELRQLNENFNNLKFTQDSNENTLQELKILNENYKHDLNFLENEFKLMNDENDLIKKQLDEKNRLIENFNNDNHKEENLKLNQKLNEALNDRLNLIHKSEVQLNKIQNLEIEINDKVELVDKVNIDLNDSNQNLNNLKISLDSVKIELQNKETELDNAFYELERCQNDLKNTKIELNNTLNSYNDLKMNKDGDRHVENLKNDLTNIQNELEVVVNERDRLIEDNDDLQRAQIRLQKEITSSGKYHDQSHIIEKLSKDLERYKQAHNNDQLIINKLKNQNQKANDDFINIKIALEAKQQELSSVRRISGVHKMLNDNDTINSSRRRSSILSRRSSTATTNNTTPGSRIRRPPLLRPSSNSPDDVNNHDQPRPSDVLHNVTNTNNGIPARPKTLAGRRSRISDWNHNSQTVLGSSTSTLKPNQSRIQNENQSQNINQNKISNDNISNQNDIGESTHSSLSLSYNTHDDEIHEPLRKFDAHAQLEKAATSELSFDSSTPSLPEPELFEPSAQLSGLEW